MLQQTGRSFGRNGRCSGWAAWADFCAGRPAEPLINCHNIGGDRQTQGGRWMPPFSKQVCRIVPATCARPKAPVSCLLLHLYAYSTAQAPQLPSRSLPNSPPSQRQVRLGQQQPRRLIHAAPQYLHQHRTYLTGPGLPPPHHAAGAARRSVAAVPRCPALCRLPCSSHLLFGTKAYTPRSPGDF